MLWRPKRQGGPGEELLAGRTVRLEPIAWPQPAQELAETLAAEPEALWRYMKIGPFAGPDDLLTYLKSAQSADKRAMVIRSDATRLVLGMASFLRIRPEDGNAELGSIAYGTGMQRSPAGTEAMYLMMRHLFDDLGWRRCEWRCDDRNERSYNAALRLGFTYEGTFRQEHWVKNANRDTAWFSILDREWPLVRAALETWLEPANFASDGRQRQSLQAIRSELEAAG
jgi:RimJ/RimL family protein N-acetyltransferase